MSNLHYHKIRDEDGEQITVFLAGDLLHPYVAQQSHPAWDKILAMIDEDDPNVIALFDLAHAVSERMPLSERVSYGSGMLFLDGDAVGDTLASHIARLVENDDDFAPFVALLENIAMNPSESSRNQMYDFLRANDFTTTYDGLIVGYKGVAKRPTDYHEWSGRENDDDPDFDGYQSLNAGTAFVNGQVQSGQISQNIGDVVEMPRNDVAEDPNTACSTGLHIASFPFASTFGEVVLEVHVHPRDVVSVPNDASAQKVRVCRYRVIGKREEPYDIPVLPPPSLVEPISVPVQVPMASDVKHPDQKEFDDMVAAALRRHRSVAKFIQKRTDWVYNIGGAFPAPDPKDVHSWSVR